MTTPEEWNEIYRRVLAARLRLIEARLRCLSAEYPEVSQSSAQSVAESCQLNPATASAVSIVN